MKTMIIAIAAAFALVAGGAGAADGRGLSGGLGGPGSVGPVSPVGPVGPIGTMGPIKGFDPARIPAGTVPGVAAGIATSPSASTSSGSGLGFNGGLVDGGWGFRGGYMFGPTWGLEGGYRRIGNTGQSVPAAAIESLFGRSAGAGSSWSTTGTGGFYLGPVFNMQVSEGLQLGARAGAYLWSNTSTAGGALTSYGGMNYGAGPLVRTTGTDEYWGLNSTWRIAPNMDVGLNYNRLKADSRAYDVLNLRFKLAF